jgi:hypothetical protein
LAIFLLFSGGVYCQAIDESVQPRVSSVGLGCIDEHPMETLAFAASSIALCFVVPVLMRRVAGAG